MSLDPDANVAGSVPLWQFSGDRFASVQPARRLLRLPGLCSFCDHGKWLAFPGDPDRVVSLFFLSSAFPYHLAYLPAQPLLAEAVPGSEEDYPHISCSTAYSQSFNGAACGVGMVGIPLR